MKRYVQVFTFLFLVSCASGLFAYDNDAQVGAGMRGMNQGPVTAGTTGGPITSPGVGPGAVGTPDATDRVNPVVNTPINNNVGPGPGVGGPGVGAPGGFAGPRR